MQRSAGGQRGGTSDSRVQGVKGDDKGRQGVATRRVQEKGELHMTFRKLFVNAAMVGAVSTSVFGTTTSHRSVMSQAVVSDTNRISQAQPERELPHLKARVTGE